MKVAGLQKSSLIDYPGKISAVIFTQGCNMNCGYCHNRQLISNKLNNDIYHEEDIIKFLEKRRGLLEGVVVSGGEPTIQSDLPYFLKKVKNMGYCVKLDTNGTNPTILKELIENGLVDYVAMDIKAPLCKYKQVCCSPVDTNRLTKSIEILKDGKVEYEFRTTYTPELNDEDLMDISRTIKGAKKYVLQQYREVDAREGKYTGVVEKRNILKQITYEMMKYVDGIQFRGEFGVI